MTYEPLKCNLCNLSRKSSYISTLKSYMTALKSYKVSLFLKGAKNVNRIGGMLLLLKVY